MINERAHKLFPDITERQFVVLSFYALGYSAKAIQLELNVSRTAIEKHLAELRYKFNCNKSAELRNIYFFRILEQLI
ncbi:LuxR C-terminal-related transcriptional regulator [Photobacterium damselae]|uniref:LuxR C-terminal-related transcriptional regulator n=1 Tax=Photobacterium damselae TaxID=38293 RepID=UPI0010FCE9DF|nr:LuxR C-terminal-related transcriptional regulator [Photobacterium damselae]TLS70674.1 response regulator transcription factor [Photobacterium damselae subsp. damselae]